MQIQSTKKIPSKFVNQTMRQRDDSNTVFLLIRALSLIVAPPPEKPLNHDKS